MASLKIRIVKDPVTGEECIPPKCKELLLRFAEHRDTCADCTAAYKTLKGSLMCLNGMLLWQELLEQPEVTTQDYCECDPKPPQIAAPDDSNHLAVCADCGLPQP